MKILILGCSDIAIRRIIPAMRKIKNLSFDIASKSKIEKKYGHKNWFNDYDKAIRKTKANIVVQINGKRRGELSLPKTAEEKEAIEVAINNNKIKNDLAGKEIKKVIYVKGRILNFVV